MGFGLCMLKGWKLKKDSLWWYSIVGVELVVKRVGASGNSPLLLGESWIKKGLVVHSLKANAQRSWSGVGKRITVVVVG